MNTPKLLRAKPPVMYRWIRMRRYFPHAVLLVCAVLSLPLGIVGGVKISSAVTMNRAMAATRAMAPEHAVQDVLSEKERMRYASALNDLITDNPQTVYSLIGQDFLIVFDEPGLRRKEGETNIWQYRTASCVLDLYFGSGGKTVHYEVRHRKIAAFGAQGQHEANVDAAVCLKEIYKQRSV